MQYNGSIRGVDGLSKSDKSSDNKEGILGKGFPWIDIPVYVVAVIGLIVLFVK